MRKSVSIGLLAVLLLFGAVSAQAQDGWSVIVGVPANYNFTKDENTNQAPDAKAPSGLRVMVGTPVRLGVGFAKYSAGFADATYPWSERAIDYSFTEFQFNLPVDPVVFAVGFGLGSAEFTPASATNGVNTWTFETSRAMEWYLAGGYRFTQQLSVQATIHAMVINAEFDQDGTKGSGAIGATLSTIGVGWHF